MDSDAQGKDCPPEQSVARFRGILNAFGISFQEEISAPVSGAFRARLMDPLHGICVNGKGSSREYCRASAYGEAMERLQSLAYAYDASCLSRQAREYLGFSVANDEVLLPLERVRACEMVYGDFQKAYRGNGDFLSRYLGQETPFIPYVNLQNGEAALLPDRLVSLLCGTNGLCAGNTPEEALCQGVAEVLERHAKFSILRNRRTPPIIGKEVLQRLAPRQLALLQRIEAQSGMRVFVRDASLGLGLPVASVLLVDQREQRYYVKYGAHPCFPLALERCLTELLQGYTPGNGPEDDFVMTHWPAPQTHPDTNRNLMGAFRSDIAVLPDECLFGVPSWAFLPWPDPPRTNVAQLRQLVDALARLSGAVYIRSMGFLGVAAYRIWAPGVSSLPVRLTDDSLRYGEMSRQFSQTSWFAAAPSPEEARRWAEALESPETALGGRDSGILRGLLWYRAGEDQRALAAVCACAKTAREKCLLQCLRLMNDGVEEAALEALVRGFFGEETALPVLRALRKRETALARYFDPAGLMRMRAESAAAARAERRERRQTAISLLHMRLKERMQANGPAWAVQDARRVYQAIV